MSRPCVTHHHACDCREAEFAALIYSLDKCREQRTTAENERDRLRGQLQKAESILKDVAMMQVSYFEGPFSGGNDTRPIKVEIRETLESIRAKDYFSREAKDIHDGDKK